MSKDFEVWELRPADVDQAQAGSARMGWTKPMGYFASCLTAQTGGRMAVWIGWQGSSYAGHVRLIYESNYLPFARERIPEINDLNVVPLARRRGLATQLMDAAESRAAERCFAVGVGVGLHEGYGAAQRMYARRGYLPDGRGVTVRNEPAPEGASVMVDDDLLLYLVKALDRR